MLRRTNTTNTTPSGVYAFKLSGAKSISNHRNLLALSISMVPAVTICMLPITSSVNITYAQTITNNTSATTGSTPSADKSETIASQQNDQAGTWKLSGTWNFNNLNSHSPTFISI